MVRGEPLVAASFPSVFTAGEGYPLSEMFVAAHRLFKTSALLYFGSKEVRHILII